jgi:hypothetical protein
LAVNPGFYTLVEFGLAIVRKALSLVLSLFGFIPT